MVLNKQKEQPFIKNAVVFLLHPKIKLTNLRYNIAFTMIIIWFLFSLFYALNNGCPNDSNTYNFISCDPDPYTDPETSEQTFTCYSCLIQRPPFQLDDIGNVISEFNAMFSAAANIIIILAALGFKTKIVDLVELSEKIGYLSDNANIDVVTFGPDEEAQTAIDRLDSQELDGHVIKIKVDRSSDHQPKSLGRSGHSSKNI